MDSNKVKKSSVLFIEVSTNKIYKTKLDLNNFSADQRNLLPIPMVGIKFCVYRCTCSLNFHFLKV